jgi:transcriptional regulator with XRE-family HTH domain
VVYRIGVAMLDGQDGASSEGVHGFASQVRERRLASGLTQEALADLSGVHRVTIARLEAGSLDPRLSTVRKLCVALEIDLDGLR